MGFAKPNDSSDIYYFTLLPRTDDISSEAYTSIEFPGENLTQIHFFSFSRPVNELAGLRQMLKGS